MVVTMLLLLWLIVVVVPLPRRPSELTAAELARLPPHARPLPLDEARALWRPEIGGWLASYAPQHRRAASLARQRAPRRVSFRPAPCTPRARPTW